MKVLLEDTWEADDIVDYCQDNGHECIVLTVDELKAYDSKQFFQCAYFCNTEIVQKHLRTLNTIHLVPDTYEEVYNKYYGRTLEKCKFGEIEFSRLGPRFVKPATNNKAFDGKVFQNENDHEGECDVLTKDTEIYHTISVQFIAEYRLLIGNGKLYGCGHICRAKYTDGMDTIINSLIDLTGSNYRCVDVGMTITPFVKWIVVEVNPPFSLDDQKIPLESYMQFCLDACEWFNQLVQNQLKN